MKKLIVAMFSFVVFLLPPQMIYASRDDVDNASIRTILRERIEEYVKGVGIVVGIVDEKGTRIVSYGTFSRDSDRPVDGNTVFEIGSITKVFTSIILADMVERGEINLHAPVSEFLPDTVKLPTSYGREITLYNLALHNSGLPRMPNNFKPGNINNPYADYTVQQMYEFLSNYKLTREIGTQFEYSNLGVGLLGHALALKAGKSYEELVKERILDPLEMHDTAITLSADLQERFATGHNEACAPVSAWDIPTFAGAGALRSTVSDMLKFIAANLGYIETPLYPAMRNSHTPRFNAGRPDMYVGLNWITTTVHGKEIVWHNGGTGGFRSFAGFNVKSGTGVVVLSNTANSVDDIGFHLLDPESKLASWEKPLKHIEMDSSMYDDYVGRYLLIDKNVLTISREENRLYAQITDRLKFEIYPETENKFFSKILNVRMTFFKNDSGKVIYLMLYQDDEDQQAMKLP